MRHLDDMGKVMLATGLIVGYGYAIEFFIAWYSGNPYERFMISNRVTGPYALGYWRADRLQRASSRSSSGSQTRAHQRRCCSADRRIVVNVGMWFERFVIIVTSLHRDFLPSAWGMYQRHDLGLGDLRRHDRPVPHAVLPVHPLPADDLDLRDARP